MFALVDLTELETPDAIRKALCMSLNVQDWDNAAIYHTEVGQFEHGNVIMLIDFQNIQETSLTYHYRGNSV